MRVWGARCHAPVRCISRGDRAETVMDPLWMHTSLKGCDVMAKGGKYGSESETLWEIFKWENIYRAALGGI